MSGRRFGNVVIIGAGPTGLAAAYELKRLGFDDYVVIERSRTTGGLARSVTDEAGFTWDIGGHVVFSHYEEFTRLLDELLEPDEWLHHDRESWIRILGTWVPYPFQNNIHRLPKEHCEKCLADLKAASKAAGRGKGANFDEFIIRTFGAGIADLFMRPYNRKVWAVDPREMEASWIADRVALPDPDRIARNVRDRVDDVSWGPNRRFSFPRIGGTGEIWRRLAARLGEGRVVTGKEVVEVDVAGKRVVTSDGERVSYDTLVSTMPLDLLAAAAHEPEWVKEASMLRRSSVHVLGIGLEGSPSAEMRSKCWMYFPEANAPFYRATHFSLYSPNNVDDITRHWSLMAEVSTPAGEGGEGAEVLERTVNGMAATGIIRDKGQVIHTWRHFEQYCYPIPALSYREITSRLLGRMEERGILSRGRFGAWRYEVGNMDHSFMQGMEVARRIVLGENERTVHGE